MNESDEAEAASRPCPWCCENAKANGGPLCGVCDGAHDGHEHAISTVKRATKQTK